MMSPLRTRLQRGCFTPHLRARTKRAVLEEIADMFVDQRVLPAASREAVLSALLEREEKMSTGMQFGVAIPHAKTECVEGLVVAVALSEGGVEFSSLDGGASHIFVATLSPPRDAGMHIRFLAEISRQLASRAVRERLLAARCAEEMVGALCEVEEERT